MYKLFLLLIISCGGSPSSNRGNSNNQGTRNQPNRPTVSTPVTTTSNTPPLTPQFTQEQLAQQREEQQQWDKWEKEKKEKEKNLGTPYLEIKNKKRIVRFYKQYIDEDLEKVNQEMSVRRTNANMLPIDTDRNLFFLIQERSHQNTWNELGGVKQHNDLIKTALAEFEEESQANFDYGDQLEIIDFYRGQNTSHTIHFVLKAKKEQMPSKRYDRSGWTSDYLETLQGKWFTQSELYDMNKRSKENKKQLRHPVNTTLRFPLGYYHQQFIYNIHKVSAPPKAIFKVVVINK